MSGTCGGVESTPESQFPNNDVTLKTDTLVEDESHCENHAKWAAIRIQTAYRQYRMRQNYSKMRENSYKRRSLDTVDMIRSGDTYRNNIVIDKIIDTNNHDANSSEVDKRIISAKQSNSCSSVHSDYSNTTSLSSSSTSSSSIKTQNILPNDMPSSMSVNKDQSVESSLSGSSTFITQSILSKGPRTYDHKFFIGLNLFNRRPKDGIDYLCDNLYVHRTPFSIANFLFNTKFLSRQMIGEYISDMHDEFCSMVLQ
jgi:hypothetical protein